MDLTLRGPTQVKLRAVPYVGVPLSAVAASGPVVAAIAAGVATGLGARTIGTSGLATGGGTLGADRTISVPKALSADVIAGADDTKAITSLALQPSLALKASVSRQVLAAGLATGGGDLSADRTITVPKALAADVTAGTDDTKAVTSLALAPALAGKAPATFLREVNSLSMPIAKKLGEMISVAEYAASNGSLTQAALTAIAARALAEGKSIFIPGGVWTTSGTLTIDRTAQTTFSTGVPRSSIFGQGSGTSAWIYSGTGAAFSILGGGSGTGHEAHQAVRGLTIVGPSATIDGSIGIALNHVAWMALDDIFITNFDKGIDGLDVEYLRAFATVIRFNKRGATIDSRANNSAYTPDPNSSDPNCHSWISSTIANNSEYGVDYHRANSPSFIGCDIQYNGLSAANGSNAAGARPGFGIRNTDPGTQGGVGLLMQGGYVEGNGGVADVWLRQVSATLAPTDACVYQIEGTGFTRTSSSARSTNFIAIDFISASAAQSVKIAAAFKNFGGVTATGPAVGFIGQKQKGDISLDMASCVYTTGEEVDEWVPYTATVAGPSGSTGFVGSVNGVYKKSWRTMRVQGTVTITTVGTVSSGLISVPIPAAIRGGRYGSASVSDLVSAVPLYGAIADGGSTVIINATLSAGRLIAFAVEFPTN